MLEGSASPKSLVDNRGRRNGDDGNIRPSSTSGHRAASDRSKDYEKTPNAQPPARKGRGQKAVTAKQENVFQFDIHGLEAQFGGSSLMFKAVPVKHEFANLADGSTSHGMHFGRDAWCYFDVNADKELTSLSCSGLRLKLTQGVINLSPELATSSSQK